MKYFVVLLLLVVRLDAASLTNSYFKNIISSGFLTLSGLTNRLTDDGSTLLYNGVPIAIDPLWTSDGTTLSPSPAVTGVYLTNGLGIFLGVGDGDTTNLVNISQSGIDITAATIQNLVNIYPGASDGSTPYLFDTSVAHTTGNLWEQKNAGTNKFSIGYDGWVTISGKTNRITDTGSTLKYNSETIVTSASTELDWKDFVYPARVDGTGVTIVTNDYTSSVWGLATHAGTGGTNVNYALYRVGTTPLLLTTSVEMVLRNLAFRVSGSDTGSASFSIGFFSPASSSAHMPTDFTGLSSFVNFTSGTLTSPAANDIFYFSDVTLTGWAAGVTAGRPLIIGIARDGGDANNDSITIVGGTIEYTTTR